MHRESILNALWKRLDYKKIDERLYRVIAFTYPIRFIVVLVTRMAIFLFRKKVILVFGMSRSGTSMLGNFLAFNDSSIYIHEPIKELMKFRYQYSNTSNLGDFWKFVFSKEQKDFKTHGLVCITLLAILSSPSDIDAICIKPISMLDTIKQASAALKAAKVLYVCRHPAGRTESIIRQRKLDEGVESVSLEQLEKVGENWGRVNSNMKSLFRDHSGWYWLFFEDLANDPLAEFKKLYQTLGLEWNESVSNKILEKTTGKDGGFYDIQRDSRKQIDKWRKLMTTEQIEAVRKGTVPFETNLYDSF